MIVLIIRFMIAMIKENQDKIHYVEVKIYATEVRSNVSFLLLLF